MIVRFNSPLDRLCERMALRWDDHLMLRRIFWGESWSTFEEAEWLALVNLTSPPMPMRAPS